MNGYYQRAALVTGAAKRIGRDIALGLAEDGWRVALHYRESAKEVEDLAEAIAGTGGEAATVRADLGDEEQAQGLMAAAADLVGPLTLLVNNAAIFEEDTVQTASLESWNRHMQINLRAPFVLMQGFQAQVPAGLEGNIVNIVDQRVLSLTPHFTSYTLSKAGLWTLTQTMAMAMAPEIRVNAIGPGPVLPSRRQTGEAFIEQWSSLPLRRSVDPREIVDAIRFIVEAPSMTGQMITLDGGQHLGWVTAPRSEGPRE